MDHRGEKGRVGSSFYYGWVVVAVCAALLGLSMGSTQYLTGVFAVPLAEEFSATRGAVLFATASVMAIAGGIASPLVGGWLRRVSIRKAMLLAIAGMGSGFVLLSFATSLWQIALVYGFALAIGTSAVNLGANTLAATWFVAKRGRALGLAAVGISVFGFILPPLASHAIAHFSWRTTYQLVGLLHWAALPFIAFLLVDRPEQRGLSPDGVGPSPEDATTEAVPVWDARAILRHPLFWPIVLPTGFCLALSVTVLTNLVPLAIDAGVDPQSAAYLASLVALSAVVGKVAFGFIADIASQRSMVWVPASLVCCACLLLPGGAGYPRLVGAALLLGFAFGAATPAWGALVGANFGRSGFSLAMGLMTPVVSVLLATCVPFAAWVHDRTGSYDSAWLVLVLIMAALAMMGRRLPRRA